MENYATTLVDEAKGEMEVYSNSLVAEIENISNVAIERATVAVNKATIIAEKMKSASTQLNTDVINLKTASDNMLSTLTTEIGEIKNQFVNFGISIRTAAQGIVEKTIDVRNEFSEAIDQVNAPMLMVKEYGRRCKEDNVIFLPINVVGMIYWAFLKGVI
jgi:hypothetical protein